MLHVRRPELHTDIRLWTRVDDRALAFMVDFDSFSDQWLAWMIAREDAYDYAREQRQQARREAQRVREEELRAAAREAGIDEDAFLAVAYGPYPYPTDESPPDRPGAREFALDSEEEDDSGFSHSDWLDRPVSEAAPGLPADVYYTFLGAGDGPRGF